MKKNKSVDFLRKEGLKMFSDIKKGDGWKLLFVPFSLGLTFADIAAVPVSLICYKGSMSFKCNPIISVACVMVGIMLRGSVNDLILALLAVVAAITSNAIFEFNDDSDTARSCMHGAVVSFLLMLMGYFVSGLSFLKICFAIFYGLVTYFGIYTFKKAGEGMGLSRKKVSVDDCTFFVGCVFFACLMVVPNLSGDFIGLNDISIRLRTIVSVVYMYFIIRTNRISVSMALAAFGGLVLGIVEGNLLFATLYATNFSIVALLTSVFSVYGFKVLIVTFLFSLNIIAFFSQGVVEALSWYELLLVGMLCLVLEQMKKKGKIRGNDKYNVVPIADETSINDGNETIRVSGLASEKFEKLAACVRKIGSTVSENSNEDNIKSNTYTMAYYLKRITGNICSKCACQNFCWNKSKCETGRALMEIIGGTSDNHRRVLKDVPQKFRSRCENIQLVLEEVNIILECAKQEKLAALKLQESQQCMQEQLSGLSDIVSQMADELKYNVDKNILSEFAIEDEIGREFGEAEVAIVSDEKGRREVEVIPLDATNNKFSWNEAELSKILSNMLDKKMISAGVKLNSNLKIAARFVEKTRYKVIAGVASAKKCEKDVSGDNFVSEKIGFSKFLCGISDGMGSGMQASNQSESLISLLKSLVEAGVRLDKAVSMVNRISSLKSNGEMFATLDACFIDLYDGDVAFVKAGAAPSFKIINNGEQVEMLNTTTMPFGLAETKKISIIDDKLHANDCVLIMSDGIFERISKVVKNEEDSNEILCDIVLKLIKKKGTIDVKSTADEILSFALDGIAVERSEQLCLGKAAGAEYVVNMNGAVDTNGAVDMNGAMDTTIDEVGDDMTVMFLKLWQKY